MWGSSITWKCLRGPPLHVYFTAEQTLCGRWPHMCSHLCHFKSGCGVTYYTAFCLSHSAFFFLPSIPLAHCPAFCKGGALVVSQEGILKYQLVHITFNATVNHFIVPFYYQLLLLIPDSALWIDLYHSLRMYREKALQRVCPLHSLNILGDLEHFPPQKGRSYRTLEFTL